MGKIGNLVFSRKVYESVIVDGPCKVTVVQIQPGRVRLSIEADVEVAITRPDAKQKGTRTCQND